VRVRIFVCDISVGRNATTADVHQPEFVERDGMQLEEEGCLSVPGFNATVARPSRAVLKGSIARRRADGRRPGLLARCFQHEMDHSRRHAVRRSPARPAEGPDRPQDQESSRAGQW
jgi:peptide deformylase